MSPIGLDIGARTPEETAVAICAEIIALRTGRAEGCLTPLRSAGAPSTRAKKLGNVGRPAAAWALRCGRCQWLR